MEFGQRLRALRLSAGMTQLELAEKIHVTKSVISYYEHKNKKPSPDVLIKFGEVFKVSTDYLLGVEKKKECSLDLEGLTDDDIIVIKALITTLKKKNGY